MADQGYSTIQSIPLLLIWTVVHYGKMTVQRLADIVEIYPTCSKLVRHLIFEIFSLTRI